MYEPISYIFTLMKGFKKVIDAAILIIDGELLIKETTKIHDVALLPKEVKWELNDEKSLAIQINQWYKERLLSSGRKGFIVRSPFFLGFPDGYGRKLFDVQASVSLFSYGLNLTDKYWLNPQMDTEYYSGLEDHAINGRIIKHEKYDNIDFFKNGFSDSFSISSFRLDYDHITPNDYKTPDLCTNGYQIKRWVNNNGVFYLEKAYISGKNSYTKKSEQIDSAIATIIQSELPRPNLKNSDGASG